MVFSFLLAGLGAAFASAQDAATEAVPAPALPKGSYTFTQWMDFESVNGAMHGTDFTTNAALDEFTQIKSSVELDLGNGIKLTPYIQDRLQDKFSPGNLYGKPNATYSPTSIAPTVSARGKISNFYYSIWQGVYYYVDPTNGAFGTTDDGTDNSYFETEGSLSAGISFNLDANTTIKIQLDNYIDVFNFNQNKNALMSGSARSL